MQTVAASGRSVYRGGDSMAQEFKLPSGGLKCSRCGCSDFRTYGTTKGHAMTFRYKSCRHCGHKIFTRQPPEEFIRDVEIEDDLRGQQSY